MDSSSNPLRNRLNTYETNLEQQHEELKRPASTVSIASSHYKEPKESEAIIDIIEETRPEIES